jgi:hypothetical protein
MHVRASTLHHPLKAIIGVLIMLCSGLTLPACGASIAHQPASQLRLAISIAHQYSSDQLGGQAGEQPLVDVSVQLLDQARRAVWPPDKAQFTCNGKPMAIAFIKCLRQPLGGAYQIGYTDERGATTIVTVPVPLDTYSLLSPSPGGAATLPSKGELALRLATPVFPADTISTVEQVIVWGSIPSYQDPYVISALPHEQATPPPTPQTNIPHERPQMAVLTEAATPAPVSTPTPPPPVPPPTPSVTPGHPCLPAGSTVATVTHADRAEDILVYSDYACWAPGPGKINFAVHAETHPAPSGFLSVSATFRDDLSYPVKWVR